MATNWTFQSALSAVGSGAVAALTTSTATKPAVGDLMVCSALNTSATTHNTAYAISDSSVGGAVWAPIKQLLSGAGTLIASAWWKVANAADNNGGAGITVTTTASGGTGTQLSRNECDIFRLPAGYTGITLDSTGLGVGGTAVTSLNIFGTSPSNPNFLDPLNFDCLCMGVSNGGVTLDGLIYGSGEVFMHGTGLGSPLLLFNGWYGAGDSAFSGTPPMTAPEWQFSWTTARTAPIGIGGSFIYTPPAGPVVPATTTPGGGNKEEKYRGYWDLPDEWDLDSLISKGIL